MLCLIRKWVNILTLQELNSSIPKGAYTDFQLWKEGKVEAKDVLEELHFSGKRVKLTLFDGNEVIATPDCYTYVTIDDDEDVEALGFDVEGSKVGIAVAAQDIVSYEYV